MHPGGYWSNRLEGQRLLFEISRRRYQRVTNKQHSQEFSSQLSRRHGRSHSHRQHCFCSNLGAQTHLSRTLLLVVLPAAARQLDTLLYNVETASVRALRPDMGKLPVDHALLHAVRAKHARAVNATHQATQECTAPIETWAQPQQTSKQVYIT